jgi:hypothetical protein
MEGPNHDPEELVTGTEARALPSRPSQHHGLMPEQEILGHERLAVPHARTEQAEQKQQVLEHGPNSMPLNACSCPDRLSRPQGLASLRHPPSRRYCDRKRAQGKRHNHAVLCLARRRVDVLHAMLTHRAPYRTPAPLAAAA